MKKYKAFPVLFAMTLLLPSETAALGKIYNHATFTHFWVLFIVAAFVAWLLYRAIRKKSD